MTHTRRSPRRWFGFRARTLIALLVVVLIGAAALALDLAFEGRIYDLLWRTTGETAPHKQVLGFAQYLMRATRAQPDTAPDAYIPLADVNPFGVNTFLEQEVELAKRERQMALIADAGFGWIRQQFPWEDIEIAGKGDFTDRRNDLDGDGEPDAISAWDKYDHIVDLAEQYGVQIMARLSAPPRWAQPDGTTNTHTPPADVQDFVDYAVAVAERYQGRVTFFQVWNEPNLYPEWGDQTVNAEAYTDMLCRTYAALKAVDPAIVVITGALGPTVDLSGRNASDLLYLQRMYQAGAGDCFDVLSAQGYGLWSGPTDRRLRPVTINYQRHLYLRDIMVQHGDAHKPIWLSEVGWNPVPDDPAIANLTYYGQVTPDEAAAWLPLAYARAIEEWPWIGVVTTWYFKRADDSEQNQSWYYFRLLEPDFTATQTFRNLRAYITGVQPKVIGAGRHGTAQHGVITSGPAGRETRTFRIDGTHVYLCAHAPPADVLVDFDIDDGASVNTLLVRAGSTACQQVCKKLDPGAHTVMLRADDWTGLDSLLVRDDAPRNRRPWLLTFGVAALLALTVLGAGGLRRLERDSGGAG